VVSLPTGESLPLLFLAVLHPDLEVLKLFLEHDADPMVDFSFSFPHSFPVYNPPKKFSGQLFVVLRENEGGVFSDVFESYGQRRMSDPNREQVIEPVGSWEDRISLLESFANRENIKG